MSAQWIPRPDRGPSPARQAFIQRMRDRGAELSAPPVRFAFLRDEEIMHGGDLLQERNIARLEAQIADDMTRGGSAFAR